MVILLDAFQSSGWVCALSWIKRGNYASAALLISNSFCSWCDQRMHIDSAGVAQASKRRNSHVLLFCRHLQLWVVFNWSCSLCEGGCSDEILASVENSASWYTEEIWKNVHWSNSLNDKYVYKGVLIRRLLESICGNMTQFCRSTQNVCRKIGAITWSLLKPRHVSSYSELTGWSANAEPSYDKVQVADLPR